MRKINLKSIAVITALTLTLTGCQSKDNKKETQAINEVEHQYVEEVEIEEQVENNNETIPSTTETIPNKSFNQNESVEFTYFKDAKEEIKTYIESDDFKSLKEKGKYYVVTGIDFIFFDEPINGIYFKDLKEELKTDIIRDVKQLDEAIMAYYPDYKEDCSSKYQVAAQFVSETYLDVLDKIKEYLGEENYNALGDIKDQIKGDIIEKKDEATDYIKNKYNEWKNPGK